MKKEAFYYLSILLLILLLGFACHSESDDDDDETAIDDDDDDSSDDDDDIADDDDDSTGPFTFNDLEFSDIPDIGGSVSGFDLAFDSQDRAGICITLNDGFEGHFLYLGQKEDGTFEPEIVVANKKEGTCAIVFDGDDRPVILHALAYENLALNSFVYRKNAAGDWDSWSITSQKGNASFAKGFLIGGDVAFFMDANDEPLLWLDSEGLREESYAFPLALGDATYSDGGFHAVGGEEFLTYTTLDLNGDTSDKLVDKFLEGQTEHYGADVALLPSGKPQVLVSVNEDPIDPNTKKLDEQANTRSLHLYRETSAEDWEYSFIAKENNGQSADLLIDSLGTTYIALFLYQSDQLEEGALALTKGTWGDMETITLYEQIEDTGDLLMKADRENRLYFLFSADAGQRLVYGRPALD